MGTFLSPRSAHLSTGRELVAVRHCAKHAAEVFFEITYLGDIEQQWTLWLASKWTARNNALLSRT